MHTETFTGMTLRWSLTPIHNQPERPPTTLRFCYEVTAHEELYVADRLWDHDRAGRRVPDPFGVYRFVHRDVLRLLFGQAPHDPRVMVRNTYSPLYSRVLPGETRRVEMDLGLPLDEYSSLARAVSAPTVERTVSRAVLVLDYRLRSTMSTNPAPPPRESDEQGFIVRDPSRVMSWLDFPAVQVRCRVAPIARLLLPGEA